jgi:hypothetical protein
VLYGSLDEFSKNWPVPRHFKKQSESKNWPVPGISKNNQNPRTGQFQVFQKTIRIQELASSRCSNPSKNW